MSLVLGHQDTALLTVRVTCFPTERISPMTRGEKEEMTEGSPACPCPSDPERSLTNESRPWGNIPLSGERKGGPSGLGGLQYSHGDPSQQET